jgi:uncharacterized integral membrane protein
VLVGVLALGRPLAAAMGRADTLDHTQPTGGDMRYVYMTLIGLATAAVLLFKFQNLTSVTVTFLTMSVTLPITLFIIAVYVLGMLSGGALWSLLRRWFHGAFERR